MPVAIQDPSPAEAPLRAFLAGTAQPVAARTLAHAWELAGGRLQVGKLAVRLVANPRTGAPFTAATLHADRLELSRVLLQSHGVAAQAWVEWCDEHAGETGEGFDRAAKFPTVRLANLTDAAAARLGMGLRDLARLVQAQ